MEEECRSQGREVGRCHGNRTAMVAIIVSVSQGSPVMLVKHFNFMNHIHSRIGNPLAKKKIRNWTFFLNSRQASLPVDELQLQRERERPVRVFEWGKDLTTRHPWGANFVLSLPSPMASLPRVMTSAFSSPTSTRSRCTNTNWWTL